MTATTAPTKRKHWDCRKRPEAERFWEKVDASGDCWEWTASKDGNGYGQFHTDDKRCRKAYRYAYETLVGPVPEGLVIDHLCRNHACVNPDHLQPVTYGENNRRGYNWIARQRHKRICKHGHPLEGENVGRHKDGTRYCRTCSRERTKRRDQQNPDRWRIMRRKAVAQ